MPASRKQSPKKTVTLKISRTTKGAKVTGKAPAKKPVNLAAEMQTEQYRHMSDAELVSFAQTRGSWWTTRAGQIERAGVKGFRANVRRALAKAAK